MPAVTTDLAIEQGADWSHGWLVLFDGDPIDDTWTARAQIRATPEATVVLYEFAPTVNPDGSVVLGVDAAESSAWLWRVGKYDLEVENADASITLRVAQGAVKVSPEVTR